MEHKDVRAMAMLMLLVFLLGSEQATASMEDCLEACSLDCLRGKTKGEGSLHCEAGCFAKCIIDGFNSQMHYPDSHKYYCHLGCSIDQCTRFGHEVNAVESCVDNCEKSICNIKGLL